MIGKTLAHYEILSKIGAGGMGEVYRARDTNLDREVALKFLSPGMIQDTEHLSRFKREAKLLASLSHPGIAVVYGLHEDDGQRFLAMELVPGSDLHAVLSGNPMPMDEAVSTAVQIAHALSAAHDQGVVHRDLKPSNVMITPEGKAKVLDFGLAKSVEASGDSSVFLSNSPTMTSPGTMAGVILGTAAYMSPEQARGKPVDRRSDLWSFGCVLFELLTGRIVFNGETVTDVIASIIHKDPDWEALPTNMPPGVRRVLERCLQKDPADRLRDAGDAALLLQEAMEEQPATVHAAASGTSSWLRFAPWAVAAVAIALALTSMLAKKPTSGKNSMPYLATSIQAPTGTGFYTNQQSLALSPDGTQLAFVGPNEEGRSQLYLRRLDEIEATKLPGTEGAYLPFWSPDSRQIAFHNGNRLMRIEAAGGNVSTVVSSEAGGASGGAWRDQNTIIFCYQSSPGWFGRVNLTSGEIEKWLEPFPNEETSIELPSFLPGGDVLICELDNWKANTNGVYAIDYATKEVTLLVSGKTTAAYAAGHLLYLRGYDLYAHRLDQDAKKLLGEPVRIAGDVHKSNFPNHAFFSVSTGGQLVYLPRTEGSGISDLVWVDRAGKQLGEPIVSGDLYNQRLSPDERRVAIDISTPKTNGDIWVFELARGSSVRLTQQPSDESRPVWINNRELYFYSGKGLMRTVVAGNVEPTQVLTGEQTFVPYDLTPDGKNLLMRIDEDPWVANLETGDRDPWGKQIGEARFSPDGRWLASESAETGISQIYVESFPDRAERFVVSKNGGSQPSWRGDGKELFYYSLNKTMMAVPMDMEATDRSPVGEPFELFTTPLRRDDYEVTKDGQRFLLIRPVEQDVPTSLVHLQGWLDRLEEGS